MSEYWPVLIIILQMIFLEGILSIDNAAVIGALVSPLPDNQRVVWPQPLKRIGEWLHPILGSQRMAALRVGLLGAYTGRGLMLFLTSFLIHNSWIKLFGAAYLIHLAFDNLEDMPGGGSEEDEDVKPIKVQSFWTTVLTVELMDLISSIDNVVAAISLSNKLWVVWNRGARHCHGLFREIWIPDCWHADTPPGDYPRGLDGKTPGLARFGSSLQKHLCAHLTVI